MLSGFELTTQVGGECDGLKCLRLKDFGASNNGDETCKLSIGNPHQRDPSGCHNICANHNDSFCLIKLFKFCVQVHLLLAMKDERVRKGHSFLHSSCSPESAMCVEEEGSCL